MFNKIKLLLARCWLYLNIRCLNHIYLIRLTHNIYLSFTFVHKCANRTDRGTWKSPSILHCRIFTVQKWKSVKMAEGACQGTTSITYEALGTLAGVHWRKMDLPYNAREGNRPLSHSCFSIFGVLVEGLVA